MEGIKLDDEGSQVKENEGKKRWENLWLRPVVIVER